MELAPILPSRGRARREASRPAKRKLSAFTNKTVQELAVGKQDDL